MSINQYQVKFVLTDVPEFALSELTHEIIKLAECQKLKIVLIENRKVDEFPDF